MSSPENPNPSGWQPETIRTDHFVQYGQQINLAPSADTFSGEAEIDNSRPTIAKRIAIGAIAGVPIGFIGNEIADHFITHTTRGDPGGYIGAIAAAITLYVSATRDRS